MVNKLSMVLFAIAVVAALTIPSYASLVPMSWGFPTLVQNSSLTSFENDFAQANDFELSNISFPTTTDSTISSAFPTITQISNQSQIADKLTFANQQQSSYFAYPWLSVGFSPVPSMGSI
jgi:hypothetical protein